MCKFIRVIFYVVSCSIILFSLSCQDKAANNQYKGSDSTGVDSLLPRPTHIVIVIEENYGFDQIMGSKEAPFINELAQKSALFNIGPPGKSAAIARADNWLKQNLQEYIQWAQSHNSLFILTFDEDDFKPQNHIVTLFYGAGVKQGRYTQKINHCDVLKTIEEMYHLTFTGNHQAGVIGCIW